MLELLKNITDDILVYTGFTLEETKKVFLTSDWEKFCRFVSVLIDGSYINDLNDNKISLRGSTNQNIIYFNKLKKATYEAYLHEGRKIQNVYYDNNLISVGIHNREL